MNYQRSFKVSETLFYDANKILVELIPPTSGIYSFYSIPNFFFTFGKMSSVSTEYKTTPTLESNT